MENVSWSSEQVLSVVNEFNDAMESLRVKTPTFQHLDFVKFALLYLKRENLNAEWQLGDCNAKAVKILEHLEFDLSNSTSLRVDGIDIRETIRSIYCETLDKIPQDIYAKDYLKWTNISWQQLKLQIGNDEYDMMASFFNHITLKEGQVACVKGLFSFVYILSEKIDVLANNVRSVDFDNFDDMYIFEIIFETNKMTECGTTLCFPNTSPKYDVYLAHSFDFSKTSAILEKLNPNGYIIAGVREAEINGQNLCLRELLVNNNVEEAELISNDFGWIKLVSKNNGHLYLSSAENRLEYCTTDNKQIVQCHYSLDRNKYDAFDKVNEFLTNLDWICENDYYNALFFLIPYLKKNHKETLSDTIEGFDLSKEKIARLRRAGASSMTIMLLELYAYMMEGLEPDFMYSDTICQRVLNGIKMIDIIDDDVFQRYYKEIIGIICDKFLNPTRISEYLFVEELLERTDSTKINIEKLDYWYGEDFHSLINPEQFKTRDIRIVESYVNNQDVTDNAVVAAQYIIFDAFGKSVFGISESDERGADADIVIDLNYDVRQFKQLSRDGVNPGRQYVTFAIKQEMESWLPVIEHLIKENLLEKVVCFNNRYLLFISQSKQDDKVVLAKFNHIDDERWLESYQGIIDELALKSDSKHVRILSLETLAANNYSISTDHYFSPDSDSDIKTNIQSIVSHFRNKYNTKDILLNIMLRVATLRGEGKPFPVANWESVKKLNDVLSSMKESEEMLMEHYVECLDSIMEIYGSETSSHEYYQPEVAKLMAGLVETDTVYKLYNPFAGLASFANLFPHANYYGEEIDKSVFSFGSFHLDAKGLLESARYTCGDSFQFFKKTGEELFDTILTIPPFLPQKETMLYDFLFNECMDHLEENGKMIVVLPSGFTFNRSSKTIEIRKKIVENHWVEKVISLPAGTFRGTNVNTCIIQLSKCANTEIVFCDATQLVEKNKGKVFPQFDSILSVIKNNDGAYCFRTPYSSVSGNNYSLTPITYKPFPAQEGTITYKLGDFLTEIKRESVSDSEGLFFDSNMLSSDVVEYRRDISDLRTGAVNEMMMPLHGDVLLLSPIQGTLKPTYLDVSQDTCYFVNRNLLAFKIDNTKVLPAYICYALSQPEMLHQIDNYRAGMLIHSEDLFNVWINLPDISTQRNIVGELARQRYAEKKQELDKMYGAAYAEKEEEFKSLKHAMGKSVAGIAAAVDNLYNYFAETGQLDTIVHKRRASTLGDKLNVIQQSVQHIAVLLKHGADFLDVSQYPMKSVTIDILWNSIAYETDRFTLNKSSLLDESIKLMTIKMNIDLFRTLVNDILSNAEKHAFENNTPVNTVRVEYAYDNSWFTLFISNNGQPFPDDVDVKKFTKRYWSAGNHPGSGIGGHDILKIMTAFQGEFELLTDYEDAYPTCYVLRFPVE